MAQVAKWDLTKEEFKRLIHKKDTQITYEQELQKRREISAFIQRFGEILLL